MRSAIRGHFSLTAISWNSSWVRKGGSCRSPSFFFSSELGDCVSGVVWDEIGGERAQLLFGR